MNFKNFFKELDSQSQQIHLVAIGKKLYAWTVAITQGLNKVKEEDKVFLYGSLTLDEMDVFIEYVGQQEALLPMIDPTAYIHGGKKVLEQVREQAKEFRNLLRKLKEKH